MSLSTFVSTATGEEGNGGTKYQNWYGLPGEPWCAMFVSWCANEADILTTASSAGIPYVPRSASCSSIKNFYSNNNRLLAPNVNPSNPNFPRVGDLVLINGTAHIGIVVETDGSDVTTIEGNYNNKVSEVTYQNFVCGSQEISYVCSNNTSY